MEILVGNSSNANSRNCSSILFFACVLLSVHMKISFQSVTFTRKSLFVCIALGWRWGRSFLHPLVSSLHHSRRLSCSVLYLYWPRCFAFSSSALSLWCFPCSKVLLGTYVFPSSCQPRCLRLVSCFPRLILFVFSEPLNSFQRTSFLSCWWTLHNHCVSIYPSGRSP